MIKKRKAFQTFIIFIQVAPLRGAQESGHVPSAVPEEYSLKSPGEG